MPYVKMKLDYFVKVESILKVNYYMKIFSEKGKTHINIYNNYNDIIMTSDGNSSSSYRILDLIHEISTRLNNNELLFPMYQKMRMKSLDNLVIGNYNIYFYRNVDNSILGMITKIIDDEERVILSITTNNIKEAFEYFDRFIYENFGFYPIEEEPFEQTGLSEFTENMIGLNSNVKKISYPKIFNNQ